MALPFESGGKIVTMPKRIPGDTKQRAVRLVVYHLVEYPNLIIGRENVAGRLGFGAESLRRWVRQVQVGSRQRQQVTTNASERILKLERDNRELREVNAILRDPAVFLR
jgi:transposase-like protein